MRHIKYILFNMGLALNMMWTSHVNASLTRRQQANSTCSQSPLTSDFATFVKDTLDYWHIPGMAVAVIDKNNVFAEGYGLSELPSKEVTPDTLFYAGSTTKAQTAACLSSLIHSGLHEALADRWSTNISSILKDDFVLENKWATDHLSLDDAVSHRTGMPRHDRALTREKDGVPLSTRDIVRSMRDLSFNGVPSHGEPRVKFHYNNYMYITLSYVIETLTKKDLKQVMREVIWDPLGMNSTYLGLEDALKSQKDLATGYNWDNVTGKHEKVTHMTLTDLTGSAAAVSSVKDYAKWIQALVNVTQAFPDKVHRDIRAPRIMETANVRENFDIWTYSLGWFRTLLQGRIMYRHTGEMVGFKSAVYWFPTEKYGFVLFANSEQGMKAVEPAAWRLINNKFDIPSEDIGDKNRGNQKTPEEKFEEAIKKHYPSHTVSNSSFPIQDMEGTYSDKGYGSYTLRSELINANETVLVAEVPELTWDTAFRFRHVFGDSWMVCEELLANRNEWTDFHPAEFVRGDDGDPAALTIKWTQGGEIEAIVTFEKTA
ncbi:Beta-lactamase/transpeptidase-like protein [Metarhizium rileyi]|uniref:Beta-lactamase/transpeptidase-like protein n=1 Tax=Metarhizium rileyi (strain RCEF 4871) TaxID=1649241 RepID=A0A167KIK8_METRR|nr:Beta-lactamase/transpeptidase-like protein [Metarhizium rileyi RCEF 4871]